MTYRPVPGKLTYDLVANRIARIRTYGRDASGEYVELECLGTYRARVRRPLGCIRRMTEEERIELDKGWPNG